MNRFFPAHAAGGTSFCLQQQKEAKVPHKDCVLLTPLACSGRFSDELKLQMRYTAGFVACGSWGRDRGFVCYGLCGERVCGVESVTNEVGTV